MTNETLSEITIMIRPCSSCNLSCKYCYVSEKKNAKMNRSTLSQIIDSAQSMDVGRIKYLWHGGEPLLAGIRFYEEAVNLQQRHAKKGVKIINEVQTNGTLLDQEYIKFFKENTFHLGISLDGTKEIHDKNRIYPNGQGSFEQVKNAIKVLKMNDIKFGGIAVLTESSCKNISKVYQIYKEMGIPSFKANPCIGAEESGISATPIEVGRALADLYDIWINDPAPLERISPLDDITQGLFLGQIKECSYSGRCYKKYIAFDYNGEAYPCNRLIGLNDFFLGNIEENGIAELMNSPLYDSTPERFEQNPECRSCVIGHLCKAGCTYSAYRYYSSFYAKDYYCEARYILIDHIAKRVIENIKNGDDWVERQ